jgi:hypothetical protein
MAAVSAGQRTQIAHMAAVVALEDTQVAVVGRVLVTHLVLLVQVAAAVEVEMQTKPQPLATLSKVAQEVAGLVFLGKVLMERAVLDIREVTRCLAYVVAVAAQAEAQGLALLLYLLFLAVLQPDVPVAHMVVVVEAAQ